MIKKSKIKNSYMVHWPGALPNQTEAFVEGIGDVLDAGLAVAGGVSNFRASRVESAAKALRERGHCLASNQVQYSLLYRTVSFSFSWREKVFFFFFLFSTMIDARAKEN